MAIVFEHGIDLPQSPNQVYTLLDDYTKAPLWLKRCEGLGKQSAGPSKVGDKLRYAYCQGGKHGLMDGVIVALEEDRLLSYKYYDKMMMVNVDFRMEATPTGTHLVHRIEIKPHSFLAKLMTPLWRMKLPKETVATMESLRKLLASESLAVA